VGFAGNDDLLVFVADKTQANFRRVLDSFQQPVDLSRANTYIKKHITQNLSANDRDHPISRFRGLRQSNNLKTIAKLEK
jgi:hypothetical protein